MEYSSIGRDDKRQTNDSRTGLAEGPNVAPHQDSEFFTQDPSLRLKCGCAQDDSSSSLIAKRKPPSQAAVGDATAIDLIVLVAGALPRDQFANRRTGAGNRLLVGFH